MTAVYSISPTLVQCFGIILIGYLAGRLKFITKAQGKGIALFIGSISLPALIFKAMVEVDFASVKWSFWLSLLLAKAIVFFVVLFATIFLKKTDSYAAAGLFGIFVSQSNDIAFGLPLLKAVFSDPLTSSMVDYVFLAAPISLAILNPIGFSLLEYEKARNAQKDNKKPVHLKHILLLTVKGVLTNPLVFMIFFGIVFNFIFGQRMPSLIDGLFTSLGAAFSSTALFFLGWKLGCQQSKLNGLQYALPVVLILIKSIFLPIIMILVVRYCTTDDTSPNVQNNNLNTTMANDNMTTYKTFAFLYGTIPTAPTVLVYSSKYNFGEQIVGSGLVIGTLFSAPVIFASIRVLQVKNMANAAMFDQLIGTVSMNASIISVICCVYALVVLVVLKSYKRRPHFATIVLISFQLILGWMGALFKTYSNTTNSVFRLLIFFLNLGLYGCPVWCSMVAVNLCLVSFDKRLSKRINYLLHFSAFLVPVVTALVAAVVTKDLEGFVNGSSYYFIFSCFKKHFAITIVFTIVNMAALVSCLVALICLRKSNLVGRRQSMFNSKPSASHYTKFEDSAGDFNSSSSDIDTLTNSIKTLETIQVNEMVHSGKDQRHITHHAVLLIIMFFTIALNLIITLLSNVEKDNSEGISLELRMLSVVLTYGQGFFSFAIFGFLKEFFTLPCFSWLYGKYLKYRGREKIVLIDETDLDARTKLQCSRFVKHHLHNCTKDIVTTLRFRLRTFDGVFTGGAFIDWLIEEGLVEDRCEAVTYGNSLMQGRVLEHCLQEHFFYDLPYFYQFTKEALEMSAAQSDAESCPP